MWMSRSEFESLERKVENLQTDLDARYRLLVRLYNELQDTVAARVDEAIGIRVIKCNKDEIKTEVFNKLKAKLFDDK